MAKIKVQTNLNRFPEPETRQRFFYSRLKIQPSSSGPLSNTLQQLISQTLPQSKFTFQSIHTIPGKPPPKEPPTMNTLIQFPNLNVMIQINEPSVQPDNRVICDDSNRAYLLGTGCPPCTPAALQGILRQVTLNNWTIFRNPPFLDNASQHIINIWIAGPSATMSESLTSYAQRCAGLLPVKVENISDQGLFTATHVLYHSDTKLKFFLHGITEDNENAINWIREFYRENDAYFIRPISYDHGRPESQIWVIEPNRKAFQPWDLIKEEAWKTIDSEIIEESN